MEIINQPFNFQLGNKLIDLLESKDYHTLKIAVAFAKSSGVLRVKSSLEKFRENGGIVNLYVGVDLGVTSYEALTTLLACTSSLSVIHAEKDQTFHTKVYQLSGEEKGVIIVGSHNLTGGGLWTNFENSALISLDMSREGDIELLKKQEEYFQDLDALGDLLMPIEKQEDINLLLQNGYISKEVNQRINYSKPDIVDSNKQPLFGRGFPASLPRVSAPDTEITEDGFSPGAPGKILPEDVSTVSGDEGDTLWFESRAMTGGSRNILDLSKTSLLERGEPADIFYERSREFTSGGVRFFGLDPTDQSQQKDITLNFEGVEYRGNTILYPKGNKNNGTWRLQIKGESTRDVGITEAFKRLNDIEGPRYDADGELLLYLQFKIISFTKIQDDYYLMSVLPETDLERFRAASITLARNGKSLQARQLGVVKKADV